MLCSQSPHSESNRMIGLHPIFYLAIWGKFWRVPNKRCYLQLVKHHFSFNCNCQYEIAKVCKWSNSLIFLLFQEVNLISNLSFFKTVYMTCVLLNHCSNSLHLFNNKKSSIFTVHRSGLIFFMHCLNILEHNW